MLFQRISVISNLYENVSKIPTIFLLLLLLFCFVVCYYYYY